MKLKLFGQLAEVIQPEVEIDLSDLEKLTKKSILKALINKFPTQESNFQQCNLAVNQVYIFDDETIELNEIEEIALIPPVSGG